MKDNADTNLLDVAIIGAGLGGLCMAIRLLEAGTSNFRLFETSPGVGGTWYENRYPGAACDVPSHFYCFSFEPNPDWTRVYSAQPEILRYIEHCFDKYDVRPHVEHDREVLRLELDESASLWTVHFRNSAPVRARHVVNAGGGLHKPRWPDIPGSSSFAGVQVHTAQWDESLSLSGKRVAIIGSAASAIQIIPVIADEVRDLTVFQRTPNYIAPRHDGDYSPFVRRVFRRLPTLARFHRWWIFNRLDTFIYPLVKRRWLRRLLAFRVNRHMRQSIDDRNSHRALTPDYELGCKRILISDDLFDTLNREHVRLVTNPIIGIEAEGVRSSDKELHRCDVLIYATGFDLAGHFASIDVVGAGGVRLAELWSDGEVGYNGCCVAGLPNYWMMSGPNTAVGTTSVIFMLEQITRYVATLIASTGPGELRQVRQTVQDRYNKQLQDELGGTVWASGCDSWYLTDSDRITTLYPGSARRFRRQLEQPDMEDFMLVGNT
ncbi:MAG: NAD(P)/FAD-dependent oxidoreductase [Pseudomonadota bacterium]